MTTGRAPRVLAIDDEPGMLEVYADALASVPAEVVAESDPLRALERVDRDPSFDLVLLDLNLPHLSGTEVLRALRQGRRSVVPVVVVTGYPCSRTAATCRSLGVSAYVRKPFDPAEIVRVVRRTLDDDAA